MNFREKSLKFQEGMSKFEEKNVDFQEGQLQKIYPKQLFLVKVWKYRDRFLLI